jgi:hypothetical protein
MGATDVYQLPWPELGDLADAPDGYQDLAQATEAALLKEKQTDDSLTYTPTFTSNGAQPGNLAWTARYQVRNGWCEVMIFGQFYANTPPGSGQLAVGLPVRARTSVPEQILGAKLYVGAVGWAFDGHSIIAANGVTTVPFFPTQASSSVCAAWNNGNGQAGNGGMCPGIPGGFAFGAGPGNIQLYGRYLV